MTVVGAVDDQGILQSPGSSSGKKKKSISSEKTKAHSSKDLKAGTEKPSKSPSVKPHRSSADSRIDELDQKWSDRFNRLEALLLAKTLDKPEPAFTTVKVTPAHSPPSGSVISTKPSSNLLMVLKEQICRLPTMLLKDRLSTNHMDQTLLLCPPPWGVDILFLLFVPSDVRRPMSGVRCPASRMVAAHLKEKY